MSAGQRHQPNEQNNVKYVINFFNIPQPNTNSNNIHTNVMDPRSPSPSLLSENSIECSLSGRNMVSDVTSNCSDESEQELTNLTWLTELRNQSLAWPDSIQPIIDDDLTQQKFLPKGSIKNVKPHENNVILQHKRPSPSERYKAFLEKVNKDMKQYDLSSKVYQTNATEKPPFNYSHIIGMAMVENGRMTLQQICSWIESKFAFFRVRKKWNNSIRHNLSLHHCFRKIDRSKYEKGKGGYWELGIDPKKCDRKRIRNRKPSKNKSYGTAKEKLQIKDKNMNMSNITNATEVDQTEDVALDKTDIPDNIEIPKDHKNKATISDFLISSNSKFIDNHLRRYDINDSIQLRDVFIANSNNCEKGSATSNLSVGDENQLGTIIINSSPVNISISNMNVNEIQHQMGVLVEDEIPQPCENVVVSSYLSNENHANPGQPNIIVEQLDAPFAVPTSETHYRPYIDGIDEAFHYLRSVDNRCDDLFDNLLDISVSDY